MELEFFFYCYEIPNIVEHWQNPHWSSEGNSRLVNVSCFVRCNSRECAFLQMSGKPTLCRQASRSGWSGVVDMYSVVSCNFIERDDCDVPVCQETYYWSSWWTYRTHTWIHRVREWYLGSVVRSRDDVTSLRMYVTVFSHTQLSLLRIFTIWPQVQVIRRPLYKNVNTYGN